MRRIAQLIALLTALAVCLGGCMFKKQEPADANDIALPEPSPEAQDMILGERQSVSAVNVALYFPAADGAGFSTVIRSIRAQSGEELLESAVRALLSTHPSSESMALSNGDTRLLSCEYACGTVTVNLSIDARSVQSPQEMLALETAIGNTLLGIEGVSGVNVLIGGQSEGFWQLPLGVQTETVASVTASYAQLQAERDRLQTEDAMPVSRKALVYFPTSDSSWLVPELRDVTLNTSDFPGALLSLLQSGPLDDACAIPSIPDGVELVDGSPSIATLSSGERVLNLDFTSALANYLAFSGLEVWELAGSIVLSACGFLPEIDAVRIMVNGDPITICDMGDTIINFPDGLMRRSDFSSRIGSVATLYLVNDRNELQPVKRAVSTRSAYSPRSLLAKLFSYAGGGGAVVRLPVSQSLYPEDLLGVEVVDGIARVNLSSGFYRACQTLPPDDERNLIYAMVNTLCQLKDIRAVRFYIEGLAADTLAGTIYLKSPLLPNPGIIVQEEPAASAEPLITEPPLATAKP